MANVEEVIRRLEYSLDKTTATLVVTDDTEERHFIGEALLIAAALFLLQQYCAGFLEGVGFKDLAKSHGSKAKQFLAKVRSGSLKDEDLEHAKRNAAEAVKDVSEANPTEEGAEQAERSVQQFLLESGATSQQAEKVSAEITRTLAQVEGS
jgi:hypothetical protein